MSPKAIARQLFDRNPGLRELAPKHLKLVRSVIKEAIALSSGNMLTREETEAEFRRRVPDSGKPSAALRAYRYRQDLTQRELAKRSGVPQPHIAAMESGARTIGLIAAKKLALALGVDFRKLI